MDFMSPDTITTSPQHSTFNAGSSNNNDNSSSNNSNNYSNSNSIANNNSYSNKNTNNSNFRNGNSNNIANHIINHISENNPTNFNKNQKQPPPRVSVDIQHEDVVVNRMLMSLLTPEASSKRALSFDADTSCSDVLFPSLAEENRTYEETIDMIIKSSNKSASDKPTILGSAFESYSCSNYSDNNIYNKNNNNSSSLNRNNSENGLYDKDKPEPFYKKRTGKLTVLTSAFSSTTNLEGRAAPCSVESSPKRFKESTSGIIIIGGTASSSDLSSSPTMSSPTMFYILTPHSSSSSTTSTTTNYENNTIKWPYN